MPNDSISYQDSGYFSPLINDYLNQHPKLAQLYNRFPTLGNFEAQILEKQKNFTSDRNLLATVLTEQYLSVETSAATRENIESLKSPDTFTVTTGHQLNLFTGPLYFLYKIVSAINLAKTLKAKYPQYNFVPVYWMATEDHDFEEINYFNFNGKKFRWNRASGGPVGRLSTNGLEEFLSVFAAELGSGYNAEEIKRLFRKAYLSHSNLSDATRWLANELFGSHGLVIIDADNKSLKREFIPQFKDELLNQTAHKTVLATVKKMEGYDIQVNPREINLFYMEDGLRERIIATDSYYIVNNTQLRFTKDEILRELENHPEKFSPNVIMRPLYQETILPNLCYIGGGGEIAYWLELKSFFEHSNLTFPILLLRNSVLLATEKQASKADRLNLTWGELFLKPRTLSNKRIAEYSEFQLDFSEQKVFLQEQFEKLFAIAAKTDASFLGAVKAQQAKQIKGLENLEKRLLKAEKRKHSEELARIIDIQEALFPNNSLQERFTNFSEFYLQYGNSLIEKLIAELDPLDNQFNIIVL
jgi:bacillithiol biosynthesis cysteine-adding enzyme BshC